MDQFDVNDFDVLNMRIVVPADNTTARTYTIYHRTEGAIGSQFLVSQHYLLHLEQLDPSNICNYGDSSMSTLKVGAIRGVSASSDAITVANDGTCTANITSNGGGPLGNRNLCNKWC